MLLSITHLGGLPRITLSSTTLHALQEQAHQVPTCGTQSLPQRWRTTATSSPTHLHSALEQALVP